MSRFQTRVHIAGPVEGNIQRCVRCGIVLIDARGAMSTTGGPMSSWREGGHVGTVEAVDGSRLRGACSIAMDRDAAAVDEIPCGAKTQ